MLNGAAIEFERVQDVPDGGVLLALPALLVLGLLSKSRESFSMSEGFYPLESIFLVLALMALGRVPSLEALRYEAPGEWGKLMGLDRIPEVRTLRQKITELCAEQGGAQRWSSALAKQWMAEEPESAGVFYADGHVRVYHGKLTDLPRRYVARERALFACHHRLLGQCDGRAALFHGQLRGRSGLTDCVARADCAAAQRRCAQPAQPRRTASRSALKPFYDRLRPRRLLARFLRPDEKAAHRGPDLSQV